MTTEGYAETLRTLGRLPRSLGYVACLVGVLMMLVARFRLAGEPWLLWSGVGVVAAGWALFGYAIWTRIVWVRSHPIDENG